MWFMSLLLTSIKKIRRGLGGLLSTALVEFWWLSKVSPLAWCLSLPSSIATTNKGLVYCATCWRFGVTSKDAKKRLSRLIAGWRIPPLGGPNGKNNVNKNSALRTKFRMIVLWRLHQNY
jgi:hypothetical protein